MKSADPSRGCRGVRRASALSDPCRCPSRRSRCQTARWDASSSMGSCGQLRKKSEAMSLFKSYQERPSHYIASWYS